MKKPKYYIIPHDGFFYEFLHLFLLACECNEEGSVGIECDEASGKCTCKENVIGDKCTQCATEFWGFSDCQGMKNYGKKSLKL